MRIGNVVIDRVAGIGEFSVLASKLVGERGRVISIEPSPDDFITLLMNLKNNNCKNVIPLNMAVSNKPEMLNLKFKGKTFESNADSLSNILNSLGSTLNRLNS